MRAQASPVEAGLFGPGELLELLCGPLALLDPLGVGQVGHHFDMSSHFQVVGTYVFKAIWRSTALLIKVEARSLAEAEAKAAKRKDVQGCFEITLVKEPKEPNEPTCSSSLPHSMRRSIMPPLCEN